MLVAREVELEALTGLIARARAGESGVLCVHGEAGAGKTTLLREAAREAGEDVAVLHTRGVESEAHLAFAALAGLLAPVLDLREELPPIQARALGAALALEDPAGAAPFAVAAGVLSLLAAAADRRPVVVIVDDLQWVDEASRVALLFAARRLEAEAVAVLLGVRDDEGLDPAGLDVELLPVSGLETEAAHRLLKERFSDLAEEVVNRVARLTRGIPLALVEIPPLLTPDQRSGVAPLEEPLPLGRGLERAFGSRIGELAPRERRALLLAASAEEGEEDGLSAVLKTEGLDSDALAALDRTGLVTYEAQRIELRHPLVRSAALSASPPHERRGAHRALAEALPLGSMGRAWHLAAGAAGRDEEAVAALAAAADDARARGAFGEAALAFARAAEFAAGGDEQGRLLLDAAGAAIVGGRPIWGAELARRGGSTVRDPGLALDLRVTLARSEIRTGQPLLAAEMLVAEADRLDHDPLRAGVILLEAAAADMAAGNLRRMIERAGRARDIAAPVFPPLAQLAGVLIAEAKLALGDSAEGDAALADAEEVLLAFAPGSGPTEVVAMAGHSSTWVERFDRADAILTRLVGTLRQAGAVTDLVYPLAARGQLQFRLGRWPGALADATEAVRLGEETAFETLLAHALGVLAEIEAGLGRAQECRVHAERAAALAEGMGAPATAAYGHGALASLALGLGDPEAAVDHGLAAERADAATDNNEAGVIRYAPDLAEALWRVGDTSGALIRVRELERQAERPRHTWTAAVAARLRGLAGSDDEIDGHFARALACHEATQQPFETARTRLLHGERLRRARRRSDARRPLREAHAAFQRLGAEPWAERAQAELRATGGPTGGAAPAVATESLTPQELQVSLLAAQGQTNREIGAGVFLSPKTVEHHLSSSFRKLGIRRRSELAGALGAPSPDRHEEP